MTRNLKSALFSALLVWAVAYPVLGLKLTIVGINIEVHNTSPLILSVIAICSLLMFVRVLFNQQLTSAWKNSPSLPKVPVKATNFLTLPSTQRWIILGLVVIALIWPFYGSRGAVDIATLILIYVMLGLGLNIVVGLAGLLDLGYVGFYAVGAYTYALLAHYFGLSFWICLPLAGLMAATFGFLLGFPVLRLRGDYLAIVTLGFGEIIRLFLRNLTDLTGGPNGISNIPKPTLFGLSFDRTAAEGMQTFHEYFGIAYNSIPNLIPGGFTFGPGGASEVIVSYMQIVVFVVTFLAMLGLTLFISRSRMGRACRACAEDMKMANLLGINTNNVIALTFVIGAALAAVAAVLISVQYGVINPNAGFLVGLKAFTAAVLGGIGSIPGAMLGGLVLGVAEAFGADIFGDQYKDVVAFGLLVLVLLFRPTGILGRPEIEKV